MWGIGQENMKYKDTYDATLCNFTLFVHTSAVCVQGVLIYQSNLINTHLFDYIHQNNNLLNGPHKHILVLIFLRRV